MSEAALETPPTLPVAEHVRFVDGNAENIETLDRFTQGLHELQAQNPEIVGATLFGSRLKGESTASSDVDCTILIDAEQLAESGIEVDVGQDGRTTWGDHEDLRQDFRSHFGEVLSEKIAKDPNKIKKGIYVQPISLKLIKKHIAMHVNYLRQYDEYRARSEAWANNPDAEQDQIPEPPDYVPLSGGISAVFSPELIPGSEQYQEPVIKELMKYGKYGELAWEDIISHVEFGEGHLETSDPNYYPTDLNQAHERFGATK